VQHGRARRELSPQAEAALLEHPWQGNIRELKSVLERACILSGQPVLTPGALFGNGLEPEPEAVSEPEPQAGSLNDVMGGYERQYIEKILRSKQGKIAETAAVLGISRKNLWEKIKKLGIGDDKEQ